jgi:Glucodextranase, domain B
MAIPTSHKVTLNGNASLRNLYNKINPIPMPIVPTPINSSGTVNLIINNSTQTPANFNNVRDITLNGNAGIISVPPGNYRNVLVNGNSKIKLGVQGSTQPVVYNLAQFTLNGSSGVQLAGPVILNLSSNFIVNGITGISNNEGWLRVRISEGSFTLNGNSTFYGSVNTPNGTITINGNSILTGNVACNALIMNGNAILRLLPIDVVPNISLAITSPANDSITNANSITVSGTASSQAGIASIFVNNQPAVYNSASGTWTISNVALSVGNNTITVRAVDNTGAETTTTITVTRTQPPPPDTTAPTLTIASPANGSSTQATSTSVSGSVADLGTNASGVASVTVNGSNAAISGGNWNFSNVGLNIGSNTITVRATDVAGNFTTETITVVRQPANIPDTTPPQLLLRLR